jgi:hypothetical protein
MSNEALIEEAVYLARILGDFAVADQHSGERDDLQLAKLLVARGVRATHTEPAAGDVTLVEALRMAAKHMVTIGRYGPGNGSLVNEMRTEADRLELVAAGLARERDQDIRIGRAVDNSIHSAPGVNDDWFANIGRAAREAVDAERGQA